MPGQLLYPISSVLAQGALTQAVLAGSAVRLWRFGLVEIQFGVTRAQLLAAEATYDGYPGGGVIVPAWSPPILAGGTAAAISGGIVQFAMADGGPGVTNIIGGFWIETAAGVVWVAAQLPNPYPLQVPGVGVTLALTIGFPSQ